jgi:hypothetical protein
VARHEIRLCANNWESSGLKQVRKVQTLKFFSLPIEGCDVVSSQTNSQIYKRTLGNNSHQMVSSVFLLISGRFCWCMDNANAQMRKKCANSCSCLIYLLNKILSRIEKYYLK